MGYCAVENVKYFEGNVRDSDVLHPAVCMSLQWRVRILSFVGCEIPSLENVKYFNTLLTAVCTCLSWRVLVHSFVKLCTRTRGG